MTIPAMGAWGGDKVTNTVHNEAQKALPFTDIGQVFGSDVSAAPARGTDRRAPEARAGVR